jgi:hypothetical protein
VSRIPVGAAYSVTLRVRAVKGAGSWDTDTYHVHAESDDSAITIASRMARRDGYQQIDPKPARLQAWG